MPHTRLGLVLLVQMLLLGSWLTFGMATSPAQQVKIQPAAPAVAPPPPMPAQGQPPNPGQPQWLPGIPLIQRLLGGNPTGQLDGDQFTSNVKLPVDPRAKRRLDEAQRRIAAQDWTNAIRLLQSLLDSKEDVFLQDQGARRISVRAEANRLLGSLPKEGKQFYEQEYGVTARGLLRKGQATGDPQIYAEVALRYLHTEAGAEAAALLGSYHLDQGQFIVASLCFDRLIERNGGLRNLTPLQLYRTALALERSGDQTRFDEVWAVLLSRLKENASPGLPDYLRKMNPEQLRASLHPTTYDAVRADMRRDWTLFLGAPNRTAQGIGSTPYLEPLRGYPIDTTREIKGKTANDPSRAWLEQAIKRQTNQFNRPAIGGSHPLAVGDLLIYRSTWGVHAVNIKTGQLAWESRSDANLSMLCSTSMTSNNLVSSWLYYYRDNMPWMLFDNSMVGTLSTDQTLVYAVEDLALPPLNLNYEGFNRPNQGLRGNQGLSKWYYHNVLVARDLAIDGRIVWMIGNAEGQPPFADTYFLGPPLPLGDKLYVMAEVNGEIRLMCMQNQRSWSTEQNRFLYSPELVWSQPLCLVNKRMMDEPGRRSWAAMLSYSDGILICPTNAGVVVGVDLLTRSLLWAHPYLRPETTSTANMMNQFQGPMPNMARDQRGGSSHLPPPWAVAGPMIQDGIVIITPPDENVIHAINLRDGSLVWRQERRRETNDLDLYLAGIYSGNVLIVGQRQTRALDLKTGAVRWNLPTGVPSGRGIASQFVYYLPVKAGDLKSSDGGEVWSIDVRSGKLLARSRSKLEVPGNLVFHGGEMISQSPLTIVAYPQLDAREREITARLDKNPEDAGALALRGEMRLYRGLLPDAVTDLRKALTFASIGPAEKAMAREKLFDALYETLDKDFINNEKLLPELEQLVTMEIPKEESDPQKTQREQEQLDRKARWLRLVARGRLAQGRLLDVMAAYQSFSSLSNKLIPSPDDPSLLITPQAYAQGQLDLLFKRATPEQRSTLEQQIQKEWAKIVPSNHLDQWREFADFFGTLCDQGREAQLELAEKLIASKEEKALREAYLRLMTLRDDPKPLRVAKSIEAQARIYLLLGQQDALENVVHFYQLLALHYPKLVIRDGKTGEELFLELATDKRFLPYFSVPEGARRGLLGHSYHHIEMLQPQGLPASASMTSTLQWFQAPAQVPPSIDRLQISIDSNQRTARVIDRFTDETIRTLAVSTNGFVPPSTRARTFQVCGPLIIFQWTNSVHVYDALFKKSLWSTDLLGGYDFGSNQYGNGYQQNAIHLLPNGRFSLLMTNGMSETLGTVGLVHPQGIVMSIRDRGLVMFDPLTGQERWVRSGVKTSDDIIGDGQYLHVIPEKTMRKQGLTTAIRTIDGSAMTIPNFSRAYDENLAIIDRFLLLKETTEQNEQLLKLFDPVAAKDVWSFSFGIKGIILNSLESHYVGGIERDGRLIVLETRTGKPVLKTRLRQEDLINLKEVSLVADPMHWYCVVQESGGIETKESRAPANPPMFIVGRRQRMVMQYQVAELNTVPVHGMVYAISKETGQIRWQRQIKNQQLIIDRFDDLPMLLMYSQTQEETQQPQGNRRNMVVGVTYMTRVQALDKRDGRFVEKYDGSPAEEPYASNMISSLYDIKIDANAGRVELIGQPFRIPFQLRQEPNIK